MGDKLNKTILVDNDLWNAFRKKCVNNDIIMKDKLDQLIRAYVEEE